MNPYLFAVEAKYKTPLASDALYNTFPLKVILSHGAKADDLGLVNVDDMQFTCRVLKSEIDRLGIFPRNKIVIDGLTFKITKIPMALQGEVIMYLQED
ncbi:MAG: hypothetical protein PHD53_00120 [Methylococcales bacterium]|nr:hypothetical protein [Methylococcales bacterium]